MKRIFAAVFLSVIFLTSTLPLNSEYNDEQFMTDFFWRNIVKLSPPERPRIAVVLSGGGARGLAHIGVLKVFEEEGVPVDIVVGTSVGALVGALYAAGIPIDKIEKLGENVGWNDMADLSWASFLQLFLRERMLPTEKMEKYITGNIGRRRFDELNIPFACVATDLVTGERVIFRDGEVALAARASATVPGIFDPVEYRHRFLVDGGLFDNIPTDVAELLGADIIIAVAVSSDFSKNSISTVYRVLTQAIYIQGKVLDAEHLKIADYVIRPRVGDVSALDLGRSKECIDAGIRAARASLPELKSMLIERTSVQWLFK